MNLLAPAPAATAAVVERQHTGLRPREQRIFDAIERTRPGLTSSASASVLALARTLADIEVLQAELAADTADPEDPEAPARRGRPKKDHAVPPPAATLRRLEQLTRRALDLGQALGLHREEG